MTYGETITLNSPRLPNELTSQQRFNQGAAENETRPELFFDERRRSIMASAAEAKNPAATTSPLLKTTLSLIFLQLFSRLFSFSLNQVLLRSTTPQALGVATMGLEVVRDTTLFLVREGIRGAVVVSPSYVQQFSMYHD